MLIVAMGIVLCTAHLDIDTSITQASAPLASIGELKKLYDPADGASEPWALNDHTIFQGPDKKWHLYAITHPLPLDWRKDLGINLLHATADRLLQSPWEKQPFILTAEERYGEFLLWAPHVIRHKDGYHLFVCSGSPDHTKYRIDQMFSPDLKSWKRDPKNPIITDGFDARDPFVLKDGKRWILYYTATSTPQGGNHTVVSLTSKDLKTWKDRKVVFLHPDKGDFGGPTESPFVVRRGKSYYLFVCSTPETNVFVSKDPYHWDFKNHVAKLNIRASEILRDTDGKWYITNSGWFSGGLSIAPLFWNDGLDNQSTSVMKAE